MTTRLFYVLPLALVLAATAACSSAGSDPAPVAAVTASTAPSVPDQPTVVQGKYTDPLAMITKVQAAGVAVTNANHKPITKGVDEPVLDVAGCYALTGFIGKGQARFSTFYAAKAADVSETMSRSQGSFTYRGDNWIVSTTDPALLEQLKTILN